MAEDLQPNKRPLEDELLDEFSELENKIKAEMEAEFLENEKSLKIEYQEKMDKAVNDVEIKLNQY